MVARVKATSAPAREPLAAERDRARASRGTAAAAAAEPAEEPEVDEGFEVAYDREPDRTNLQFWRNWKWNDMIKRLRRLAFKRRQWSFLGAHLGTIKDAGRHVS